MGALRQKIDALFDYRGDIAKYVGSNGPRVYSNDYSPNNIRRVVVSPNGVLVVYHCPVAGTGKKSYKYEQFKERELYLEEQDKRYKPILSMLANPLVCGSVEEIVVLSNSVTGQVHPNYMNEIRLEAMVSSFKGAGSDLKEKISARYKRLRYYTVLNMHFMEFMNYFMSAVKTREMSHYSFFSEMPGLRPRAEITEIAGDDYWKYWNVQTQSYAFDTTLQAYFSDIRQKREAEIKSKAVDAARAKRVGGKIEAINALIEDFIVYNKLWTSFVGIVKKEGTNGVLPDLNFVRPVETVQLLPFKGMKTVDDKFLSKQPCSEAEAFEKDEAMLKNYKAKCSKALAEALWGGLNGVIVRNETTLLRIIVAGCDPAIYVPTELEGLARQVHELTGVQFGSKNLEASVVNSCSQFMRYFVDCENTQPFTKEYWRGKLSKGVAK